MKGIIFSEFLAMIDEKFSIDMTERLIDEVTLPSGGDYTTVGTYDVQEIVDLVVKLSEITKIPIPDLLKTFGFYLLPRFAEIFPQFFNEITTILDFLPRIESYIHLEVKKLYHDAELPSFTCVSPYPGRIEMKYRSVRNFPDLAEGLILGAANHFNERIKVERESISEDPPAELFIVTKLEG